MRNESKEMAVKGNDIVVLLLCGYCCRGLFGMSDDGWVVTFSPVLENVISRCLGHHASRCAGR